MKYIVGHKKLAYSVCSERIICYIHTFYLNILRDVILKYNMKTIERFW